VNEHIDGSIDQIQFLQFIGLDYQGNDIMFIFTWTSHYHTLLVTKNFYSHLELYNNFFFLKKRKIYQKFQNNMCFPFLHYISKNEKKAMHVVKKKEKKRTIASF
jgi:hypothetical protein